MAEATNYWKPIGYLEHRGQEIYWTAKCTLCRNIFAVRLKNIQQNKSKCCRKCSAKIREGNMPKTIGVKNLAKQAEALRLRAEGKTFKEIGEKLNISSQRAHQIVYQLEKKLTEEKCNV